MTTGQLVFYSGLVLLGLTIITAIIFIAKKPRYTPENAAYSGADAKRTQKLRNGYPTDRLTIRREQPVSSTEAEPVSHETIPLESKQGTEVLPTERISGTVQLTPQTETEVLSAKQGSRTIRLVPETERLSQEQRSETIPLALGTEKLSQEQDGGTARL